MTELLTYAERWPWLLLLLVGATAALTLIERVFALSGPVTKLMQWWRGREIAKLRREAEVRAERRRIAQEEESAIVAGLREEVEWLRGECTRLREELDRLRADTAPMRASRNPARPPVPGR